MERSEVERSWRITREHLATARAQLPAIEDEFGRALLASCEEYLEHNELQLAMEDMAEAGERCLAPLPFWSALSRAADNMGLEVEARRYQSLSTEAYCGTDAWILLAITLASNPAPASLADLMSAADHVNHALPTEGELHGALWRLVRGGWVREENGSFDAGPALAATDVHAWRAASPRAAIVQVRQRLHVEVDAFDQDGKAHTIYPRLTSDSIRAALTESKRRIASTLRGLGTTRITSPEIVQSSRQEAAVIRLEIALAEMRTFVHPGITEALKVVTEQKIGPAGPWFIHVYELANGRIEFDIGVPVRTPVQPSGRVKPGCLPAARIARTVYHGPYEGVIAAWGEFEAWMKQNGHQPAREMWDVYLVGPESGSDSSQWQTQLNRVLAN